MESELSQNKMGTMPIRKLLISMSLPMMASMLVQALYNIVDSIFVARVSEAALTAVSISFPIQNLMIAFGVGIGVGVNALLSKSLGEGDQPRAQRIALQGIFIEVICCVIFILVGIFAMDLFFRGQTADAEIIALGKDYLSICCIFSVGLFAQLIFERLLQATGRTVLSMISQCAGALINIIFDPILIFGVSWLGIPAMGVTGAAIATVFGQIVGGIVAIVLNVRRNRELDLRFRGFRLGIGCHLPQILLRDGQRLCGLRQDSGGERRFFLRRKQLDLQRGRGGGMLRGSLRGSRSGCGGYLRDRGLRADGGDAAEYDADAQQCGSGGSRKKRSDLSIGLHDREASFPGYSSRQGRLQMCYSYMRNIT